jgi:hypothetical protein
MCGCLWQETSEFELFTCERQRSTGIVVVVERGIREQTESLYQHYTVFDKYDSGVLTP